MSNRMLNAAQRTAAGIAILAAAAALHAAPAEAGSVITSNCLHGFGYGFGAGYSRSYSGYYGGGSYGGNGNGYGSAWGGGYSNGGCVDTRHELVNPYVIHIPQPQNEKDLADTETRERLWQARCRPVIRQDAHGVRRYHYAAPGCEYGKYE